MTYHPELRGLEHAAELEKPFAVAGVAYAAADKEGSQGRFCQEACSNIVREVTAGGQTIHLSDLISSDGIDLLAQKGGEDQQVTQKSTLSETYYNYASFLAAQKRTAEAREWTQKILAKKPTMPGYLRRRERPWFRRASGLLKRLPA